MPFRSARFLRSVRQSGAVIALAAGAAGCDSILGSSSDHDAPAITLGYERNASNQRTANVGGLVTDSIGVTRMVYRVNGGAAQPVSITPGTSVNFSAPVALATTVTSVEFTAYDAAGNHASAAMDVYYDTDAPTLSVLQLREGGTFSSFLRIDGAATDPVGISRVTYRVNGGAEKEIPGGHFSRAPNDYSFQTDAYGLPLGPNTFVVTAYDRAGNTTQRTATMTRVL